MLEAIPISVFTPMPHLVVIVRPADEPSGPTRDSPLVPARVIPKDQARPDQIPKIRPGRGGGHTRKVSDSTTGYTGHHHGRSAQRWPERSELDWDAVVEMDLEPEEVGADEEEVEGARDVTERDDIDYDTNPL